MNRQEFWSKAFFAALENGGFPSELADEALAAYDKRFTEQPNKSYSCHDLPPFAMLEDGVLIDGVQFWSKYDQGAKGNFCIMGEKDGVLVGPLYSNTYRDHDFKKWWETQAGSVVQQAIKEMNEGLNSK